MTKKIEFNDDSKAFAFLGIFLTVIGFLIVLLAKKKDHYAMYYAKQGLVLFLVAIIFGAINMVLSWIPFIGWLVETTLWLLLLVLWIIGLIYSLSGTEKDIPVLGAFAKKINV